MIIYALAPYALWIKSFHVISMVAWMAGLLYLPRLFVYHTQTVRGSMESERFKVMEHKLLKGIVVPAMLATWVFGILLVLVPGLVDWHAGWWHIKLTSVILMSGFTGVASKWQRQFMEDRNQRSGRYFRFANEMPAVLLVIIVIAVIVQPF